jgi:phosphosulfolactate phosphohydrolase-like enzyme
MTAARCEPRVWLEAGADGARRAGQRGNVIVIIDALRASATIVAGLRAGAKCVIPVLTVEETLKYQSDPAYRLAGERGGVKLPHFDFGNSPTEIVAHRAEVSGRVLVVTTSNGTRCVHAALPNAAAVLIGSTVNAGAVALAAHLQACQQTTDVTLVAAGLDGGPAPEDTFAQRLIAMRLCDLGAVPLGVLEPVDEGQSLQVFLHSEAAGVLAGLGYEDDIRLCAQIDIWDTVPLYGGDGFHAVGAPSVACEQRPPPSDHERYARR